MFYPYLNLLETLTFLSIVQVLLDFEVKPKFKIELKLTHPIYLFFSVLLIHIFCEYGYFSACNL